MFDDQEKTCWGTNATGGVDEVWINGNGYCHWTAEDKVEGQTDKGGATQSWDAGVEEQVGWVEVIKLGNLKHLKQYASE